MNSFVSVKQNRVESAFQFIQEIEALILPEYTEEEASNQAPFVFNKRAFYSKQIVQLLKILKSKKEKKREILQLDSDSPGYIDKYLEKHGSVMTSPFSHHFISEIQHHLTQKEFKDFVHLIESAYSQTIGRYYLKQIKLHIKEELQKDDREEEQLLLELGLEQNSLKQKGYTGELIATHEANQFWIVKKCLKQIEDQLKQRKKSEWIQSFQEFSDLKKKSVFQVIEQIEKTILPDYTNSIENENLNFSIITYLPKARHDLEFLIEQEKKPEKPLSFYLRCLIYLKSYPFDLPFACSYSEAKKLILFIFKSPTLRSQAFSSKWEDFWLDSLRKSRNSYTFDNDVLETNQKQKTRANKQKSIKRNQTCDVFKNYKNYKNYKKQILKTIPLSELHGVRLFVWLLIVTKRDPFDLFKEVKEKLLFRIGCHYLLKIKEEIRNESVIQFNSQDPITNAHLCIKELEKNLFQKKEKTLKQEKYEDKKKEVDDKKQREINVIFCAQFYLKKVKEKLQKNEIKQLQIVQQIKSSSQRGKRPFLSKSFFRSTLLFPGYIEKYLIDHKNIVFFISRKKKETPLSFPSGSFDDKKKEDQLTQKDSKDLVQEVESATLLRIGRHYLKQIKKNIKPSGLFFESFLNKDFKNSPSSFSFEKPDDFDQKEFCDTFQLFQEVANLLKKNEYTLSFAKDQDSYPVVVQKFVIKCIQLIVKQIKSLKQKEYTIDPISTKYILKHLKNHGSVTPLRFTERSFTLLSYQTWLLALKKKKDSKDFKDSNDSKDSKDKKKEDEEKKRQRAFEKLCKAERNFYSQKKKSGVVVFKGFKKSKNQLNKEFRRDTLRLDTIKSLKTWIAIKTYVTSYLNHYKLVYPLCKDRNIISGIQQKVTEKESKDLVQEVRSATLLRIGCHYLKQIKQKISLLFKSLEREIFLKRYSQNRVGDEEFSYFAFHKKYQNNHFGKDVIPHARHYLLHIKSLVKQKEKEQQKQWRDLKQKELGEGFQLFEEVEALILPGYTEEGAWDQKLVVKSVRKLCGKLLMQIPLRKQINDDLCFESLRLFILKSNLLKNKKKKVIKKNEKQSRATKKQIKQNQKKSLDLIGEVKSHTSLCIGRYFLKTIKEHVKQKIKDHQKKDRIDLKQKKDVGVGISGKVKKQTNLNTKNLYFANYENVIGYCRHYLKRIEKELKQKERKLNEKKQNQIKKKNRKRGVIRYARHYLIEIKEKIKIFHLKKKHLLRSKQEYLRTLDLKRKGFDYLDSFNKKRDEEYKKEERKKVYVKKKKKTRFPTLQYSLGWLIYNFLRFLAKKKKTSSLLFVLQHRHFYLLVTLLSLLSLVLLFLVSKKTEKKI